VVGSRTTPKEAERVGYAERPGSHKAVAAVWFYTPHEASKTGAHVTGRPPRASHQATIAADGCFDLIVRVGTRGLAQATVYTPVAAAHGAQVDAGTRVTGIRLRPGYGAALLERGAEAMRAIDRYLHEGGRDVDRLERLLGTTLDAFPPPDLVTEFVARAREREGRLQLTNEFSRCERSLQRACLRWLGLTPKTYLRIERAWAARRAIGSGHPLAAVAADLGYSDQPHLTRELRRLLGSTPGKLRPVGILQDGLLPNR
jgi:AraC-like DNA-binding protein